MQQYRTLPECDRGDLIGDVIKDTGLPEREPDSMFMGEWIWDYPDFPEEDWKRIEPTLKERITALYNCGQIRYGAW